MSAIGFDGDDLAIEFAPAILHRSIGVPGEASGTCWTQNAVLFLSGGTLQGTMPRLPCPLYDGSITTEGRLSDSWASLEESSSVTHVELEFSDGNVVRIESLGFKYNPTGYPKYLDVFPGRR